ncbi:hypothetical protein Pcac1_g13453 [Phytophthora cactorum]|uniref:Uncharacterized protein n=1 Tax=Phytophthora cactorum TaxID=29920 RepID=A0A8T1C256_9STRA|nr:hypothetical protein Pcac1_g13453 [Phytophthora cactorum]KAG3108062.1 hypothetical protein PI125_g12160 [Phytophthora idaei]KAG2809282.1 hypothetical protein PC112_g16574 [Phytophthora cactorum]KAG2811037.1 hypothetical protein PC111_g15395 [Phytophthora cactorum]KAG2851248.1 hypothetical protein PC113_g16083 [Phytophthora cactorum]
MSLSPSVGRLGGLSEEKKLQTARIARQTRAYSGLVNKESHIAADQKLFATVKRPTYIKRESDGPLLTGMFLGLGVGFVQIIRGEVSMATGTGKKE